MADSFTVTVTGARELIAELDFAITHVVPEALAVTKKGAQNVKTDWQATWRGIKHAPRLPQSISYDIAGDWRGISAEIGAEDGPDKQGFLAPVIEFGGIHNAPNPGGLPALAKEEPRFQSAIEAMQLKLLP